MAVFSLLCLSGTVGLAGCGGSAASVQPIHRPSPTPSPTSAASATPSPSPTPTAAPAQHLYVGDDGALGIVQYALPLTSSATPGLTIADTNVTGLAVDAAGNLASGDNAGTIKYFPTPLSGASTPSATFENGTATNNGQLTFQSGMLFAANVSSAVNVFAPPFSNASVPSSSVTDGAALSTAIGATFDASGNLYVTNTAAGGGNVLVFASPYTGAPTVTTPPVSPGSGYRKAIVIGNQLFVCLVNAGNGQVDVYNLPLTSSSAPAFSMTNGVQTPEGLASDSAGNLYVANLNNSTITEYAPAFTAASAPTLTLSVGGGTWAIFGIAVGP